MTPTPPRRPGTVVWIDLATTDVDRSMTFYEQLFGWKYRDEQDSEMGRYVLAGIDGGEVGGMMALPPGDAAMGIPAAWSVVVGVEQLEATLARTAELGGTVLQGPMAIPGGARVAAIADPSGATLALLESTSPSPGMAWGEPGAPSWVECMSRDPGAARTFLEELFGWKGEEGTGEYTVFHLDGELVAGLLRVPPSVPAEAPSSWLVYFDVVDAEVACARAEASGGRVLEPIHRIDEGRFAVLADPTGAVFAVFERGSGR